MNEGISRPLVTNKTFRMMDGKVHCGPERWSLAQSYCGRLKMLKPGDSPGVQRLRLLDLHDLTTPPKKNTKQQNVLELLMPGPSPKFLIPV